MTTTKTAVSVEPWGIEADAPRNNDLIIQCIPGCRLRGAVNASKPATDYKTGEPKIPQDQARHLGQLPPIPGMQLHVNPAKLTYTIIDPLYEDEDLCERIRRGIERSSAVRSVTKLRGVAPQKGELDEHRMKSLVREMVNLVKANEAKVVKGALPAMDAVDELPGRYLLNPGARVANQQPVFEDQWSQWLDQLVRAGG